MLTVAAATEALKEARGATTAKKSIADEVNCMSEL